MISIEDFKKITEYLFEWCSLTGFSKEWSRKEDERIEKFLGTCNIDSTVLLFEFMSWVFLERNRIRRGSLPSITHLTGVRAAQRYFADTEEARKIRYFNQKDIYKRGWVNPIREISENVFNKEYFKKLRDRFRSTGRIALCAEYLPYIFDSKDCRGCELASICQKML